MTYVVIHRKNGLRSLAVCVLAQLVCVPVNASTITYDGQDLGDSTAIHLDASDVGGEPGPLDFRFGPALGIGWIRFPVQQVTISVGANGDPYFTTWIGAQVIDRSPDEISLNVLDLIENSYRSADWAHFVTTFTFDQPGGQGNPVSMTIGAPTEQDGTPNATGVGPTQPISSNAAAPTPEPSTWAMMLLGLAGLGFAGYRASRRTTALAA